MTVTRQLGDNTAALRKSKKTTLSSKLKPAATETRDDLKDKDFAPPKIPHLYSELPIEDIPLNKYGNEIDEDLPPVKHFAIIVEPN